MPDKNMVDLYRFAWPASRLGEAIEYLARKEGISPESAVSSPVLPQNLSLAGDEALGRWVETVADRFGLEAEPVDVSFGQAEELVRAMGPALLRLPSDSEGERRFLILLKDGRTRVPVVAPDDLSVHHVRPEIVRDALCHEREAPFRESTEQLLNDAGIPEERRAQVRRVILDEQLGQHRIGGCWLVRLPPSADLWRLVRRARLTRPLFLLTAGFIVQQLLLICSWWMIGRGALQGHFDWGWLLAWALISLTIIPFQIMVIRSQSRVALGMGGLFKQRLLFGLLHLEPEEIRHQGAGQFLGRVMESAAFEQLALSGGFIAILAVIQIGMAAVILSLGTGGSFHTLLLLIWLAVTVIMGWLYFRRSMPWTDIYQDMTNDLVERMIGYRTRLAQEDPEHWHDEEDRILSGYLKRSEELDRIGALLDIIPRSWVLFGLVGIAYAFINMQSSPAALAISLGGILLAFQALTSLVMGVRSFVEAMTAWKQVGPLFRAATRHHDTQSAALVGLPDMQQTPEAGHLLVTAGELDFRYRDRRRPVLRNCNLQIYRGDRLLLEGPSGGGKSTLAAVLAGLRVPESGLLLLEGLDRQSLGSDEWRRRVVAAPQFHENHVFSETFVFNLLMGRRWPPLPEDLREADEVCRELGLGELIERMPAGLRQMIGESGWQLSHGERSRLYIARAILQKADLVILDESFGALDPENLRLALRCVLNRAPTLLVIAHP